MRTMRGPVAIALLAALALLCCGPVEAAPSLEAGIKATFLYKFVPFVQWPQGAFATATSPVNICTIGNDPVTNLIDDAVANQRVEQRPIAVRHLTTVGRDDGCHILYVTGPAGAAADGALLAVRGLPVLTVTDAEVLPNTPAVVSFVLQANRVSFDIDEAAAARNELVINSKLLSLARRVRPRP